MSKRALQRLAASILGLAIIAAVAAPGSSPARGDGTTAIAVQAFSNEAGAAGSVAADLSAAAYRAISSTSGFSPRGGGPLGAENTLIGDPFVGGLSDAAKVGADEVLLGSIVQSTGGQVYYRLTLYRVAPMAFVNSQVFSQPYPGSPSALAAGLSSNLSALSAGHRGSGTIYSVTDGAMADVGSEEGFNIGDTFSVTRNGQRMADATISNITDDEARLSFSNAVPGYQPAVGDYLTSTRSLPPIPPAPPAHSTFNIFALVAAAGGALLAIGHHGQPGAFCATCVAPSPSAPAFIITGFTPSGQPPTGTITFTFSQPVNSTSQIGIAGDTTYASFSLQPGNVGPTTPPAPLSQFGQVTFDPTGTIMTLGEQGSVLIQNEGYEIVFTTLVTSTLGQPLPAEFTTGLHAFSIFRRAGSVNRPKSRPVPPPGIPGKPGPGGGKPPAPKPPPAGPPIPH